MAKLKGPALSIAASGKLGGAIVYSNWKGRSYAKQLRIPENPKTAKQFGARSMLRFLSMKFATLSTAQITTWHTLAGDARVSHYNAFSSFNLTRWHNYLMPTKGYPPNEGAPAGQIVFAIATPIRRGIEITVQRGDPGQAWGITLHRGHLSGFTKSNANCTRVLHWPWTGASEITYYDGPLEPDTYYYKFGSFSESGRNTPDPTFQISATVT